MNILIFTGSSMGRKMLGTFGSREQQRLDVTEAKMLKAVDR